MEKREKIIVVATVVAALYGAVDFLFLSNNGADAPLSSQDSPELLSNVAAKLASQTHGENDKVQQLVHQINTPWPQKVFLEDSLTTRPDIPDKSTNTEAIKAQFFPGMFVYSGFLQMGTNKMAIINGTDYKLGDNINGFTLAEISPKHIKIVLQEVPFNVEIQPPNKP